MQKYSVTVSLHLFDSKYNTAAKLAECHLYIIVKEGTVQNKVMTTKQEKKEQLQLQNLRVTPLRGRVKTNVKRVNSLHIQHFNVPSGLQHEVNP